MRPAQPGSLSAAPRCGLPPPGARRRLPLYLTLWRWSGRGRAHRPEAPSTHRPPPGQKSTESCGWQGGAQARGATSGDVTLALHMESGVRRLPPTNQHARPPRDGLTRFPWPPTACGHLCQSWRWRRTAPAAGGGPQAAARPPCPTAGGAAAEHQPRNGRWRYRRWQLRLRRRRCCAPGHPGSPALWGPARRRPNSGTAGHHGCRRGQQQQGWRSL